MRILIAGASGLIGSSLVPVLRLQDHEVKKLVRRKALSDDEITWNPEKNEIQPTDLEGFDAVINLAGENIFGRWTANKKQRIRDSRVITTRILCQALSSLKMPPKVLLNASAMGIYGESGDAIITEETPPGEGFLADVCREWEASTKPAEQRGIRVVHMRFGIVLTLTPKGGALKQMLLPFKMGLGGRLGSGTQYMSWIALDDLLNVIQYLLDTPILKGAVNVCSPQPITNTEFTKKLGEVLQRPTLFPVPAFVLRMLLGDFADEGLLASTRMLPKRLLEADYRFAHPDLTGALNCVLTSASMHS